jgi:uncharacterized protein DUF6624
MLQSSAFATERAPLPSTSNKPAGSTTTPQERIAAQCPHAEIANQELARQLRARQPDIKTVTRPALQRELLLREQMDQEARRFVLPGESQGPVSEANNTRLRDVDAANLRRLKEIIHQDGFPSAAMVGYNGVAATWLLVQHADRDPTFQSKLLPILARRAHAGELSLTMYAMLFDRVRLAQGKKQRYGTQYTGVGENMTRRPTEDETHLNAHRRAMGLVPIADYECVMHAVYDGSPTFP